MQGTVTSKSSRKVNTKFGEKDTYSVQIDGQWYGNGFKPLPEINDGDTVEFEFSMNGAYKNISHITKVAGGASTPASGGRSSGGAVGKPNDVQQAIMRQNALAHATSVVVATKAAKETDDAMAKRILKLAPVFVAYADGSVDTALEAEATDAILQA